jgi:hypothetical protein
MGVSGLVTLGFVLWLGSLSRVFFGGGSDWTLSFFTLR